MSFLSTAFLIALPLIAAPLLLHWYDRKRNKVIHWGAMEFLIEASARKTSARRLKQWLLLLLRCLAIAALVFALARPLLPSGWLGGHHQGETIFVVDNSISMMRKTQSGTMMQAARDHAIGELSELPHGEDIRIVTAAPYPVWGGTGSLRADRRNRDWISDRLSGLEPTQGRSDLLAALFTAVQADHGPTHSARRIVVLTDGQAADWGLEDESGWKHFREVLNSAPIRTEIKTVRLDQTQTRPSSGNVAIDRLSVQRPIVGAGQSVTLSAHIVNHAPSRSSTSTLVWQVDQSDQHEETVEAIDGGQAREASWVHTFARPGIYQVGCRIDCDDDLSADNKASLVVEVVDRIPIVIVEDAFELAEMQQDSYFVQASLGWIDGEPLDETSIYVPTLLSPAELATTDLSSQRVVVIPNLTRLEGDVVETLTEFVSGGGGLWIALGPRTDIDSFNHHLFADASGLSPLRVDRVVDTGPDDASSIDSVTDDEIANRRRRRIDPFHLDHPATRQLADNNQSDLGEAVIQRRFHFVTPEQSEKLSVLLRLSNGEPLAAENFVGQGRVIIQAVPLRLQWSDLARTQSFVVMVRDWIDYLAQPRATRYNLEPGEPIVMRSADSQSPTNAQADSRTAMLTTPQGDAIELTAENRDGGFVFRSSRTRLPGEYKLEVGLANETIPFHVRRDAEESNLKALSSDAEKQIAASTTAEPTSPETSITAAAHSDPLWPYLLIGLIVLIAAELTLSGVLSRERFGSAGIPEFSEMVSPSLASMTENSLPSRSQHAPHQDDLAPPISSEAN